MFVDVLLLKRAVTPTGLAHSVLRACLLFIVVFVCLFLFVFVLACLFSLQYGPHLLNSSVR